MPRFTPHTEGTKQLISEARARHGESPSRTRRATPEYAAWLNIHSRTKNPTGRNACYAGVTVDPRWDVYENFLQDMGRRPGPGFSIERIKPELGYAPGNCTWATARAQSRNRPTFVRRLTFQGETLCVAEWGEKLGIPAGLIRARLHRGWTPERALSSPTKEP